MQRQSLGSPSRERLVISSTDAVSTADETLFSTAAAVSAAVDDEIKPEKPHRSYSPPPEKFIHFIPLLLLFSFFILYLSSHNPSPQDLAQFRGYTHKIPDEIIEMNDGEIDKNIDTNNNNNNNNNNKQFKRSNAFVIRSLRNLQEEEDIIVEKESPKSRSSHRKLGDF